MLSHLTDGAKLPEIFFRESNGGLNYAEKNFKLDAKGNPDYRKMKDHFDTVCKYVYQDIRTGNQSGKEGDLSEKYNKFGAVNYD